MITPPTQEKLFEETKTVRVTVPVSPEVLAEFQRLAAASGVSVGKAMGEWLSDTVDGVRSMRELLEKAKEAPKLAVAQLNSYALGLSDLTAGLLADVQMLAGQIKKSEAPEGGATIGRRAAGASATPLPPRPSNTGGKVLTSKPKGNKGTK